MPKPTHHWRDLDLPPPLPPLSHSPKPQLFPFFRGPLEGEGVEGALVLPSSRRP